MGPNEVNRTVRVILVDDHSLVLDTMSAAIEATDEIRVVGTASSLADAMELTTTRPADVLVTDLQLGDGRGTELVEHARSRQPPVAVLLITGHDDVKGVHAAVEAGCSGFVSKTQGFDDMIDAILAISRGAAVFPAELLYRSLDDGGPPNEDDLTRRELEVLQMLAEARSVPEIARSMHLSPYTVRNHIKQILAKLDVHSQLAAVVKAARRGYVEIA